MIESFSDFLSLAALVIFSLFGIWLIYSVTVSHREETMKKREAVYYHYYDDSDDDSDDDEKSPLYYED